MKIPYNDITITNNIPKNNFVLNNAKRSNTLDSFTDKTCVMIKVTATKIPKASRENSPVV